MAASESLWTDEARTRQFVLPDGATLPRGELHLRTATGRRMAVDPEAVRAFEVTPDQARVWLKGRFAGLAKDVRGALGKAWRQWRENADGNEGPETEPNPDDSRAPGRPGAIELLAALTGMSPEALRRDPSAIRGAFTALSREMGAIVIGATAREPGQLDAARDRIKELRDRLARRGIATSKAWEDLPARLHPADDATDRRVTAAQLEALADGVTASAEHLAALLRQLAVRLRAGDPAGSPTGQPDPGPPIGESPADG